VEREGGGTGVQNERGRREGEVQVYRMREKEGRYRGRTRRGEGERGARRPTSKPLSGRKSMSIIIKCDVSTKL
jgi:hypothetical protein